jgi:hypothetical protein
MNFLQCIKLIAFVATGLVAAYFVFYFVLFVTFGGFIAMVGSVAAAAYLLDSLKNDGTIEYLDKKAEKDLEGKENPVAWAFHQRELEKKQNNKK